MDSSQKATDKAMMARCIELSRIAVSKGEYPFGAVIALDGHKSWWKRSIAPSETVT
jgi:tRNA(Arg) A34 adenosine deaminase TadA